MRALIINIPHPSIGSRIPDEHLPPLGLLAIGGPLVDAGHEVKLLDAELAPLSTEEIVAQARAFAPEVVLFGHSGSTSAHPIIASISAAIKRSLPRVYIVYGGVFPTYHWREVLLELPQVDVVVRGEGEETAPKVLAALQTNAPLDAYLLAPEPSRMHSRARSLELTELAPEPSRMHSRARSLETIPGIAYRDSDGVPRATAPAPILRDLDATRIGWELIDHRDYTYWGNKRAVVVQFSRGCPHKCNYCGQRGFWTRWRHRDPKRFAAEIAKLHREQGVEVFNFADENPTASRSAWRAFLEALIAENVHVILVGSTRADDIVRDRDILHLYKKAGVARFLLGMENTDEATLALIRKGGTTTKDREAIRLMREHDILSMATWVVGFAEETDRDYLRGLRQLLSYDPDQIQALYVTPHRWTPFFRIASDRRVLQQDRSKWDYKHQVLSASTVPPWRTLMWVKSIEAIAQLRPAALKRVLAHRDPEIRDAMRWYYRMGRRVWPHEVLGFFLRDTHTPDGPTVRAFWGDPQDAEEEAMAVKRRRPERASAEVHPEGLAREKTSTERASAEVHPEGLAREKTSTERASAEVHPEGLAREKTSTERASAEVHPEGLAREKTSTERASAEVHPEGLARELENTEIMHPVDDAPSTASLGPNSPAPLP